MFNTIIVDDEETIREGLSKYIGRSFPELNIIGVFSDGKDAIEFLESNHSDVVLTDIKMSEKSGIDVAQFIFENSPDTKVVFLSAYQEFEYAKQAIKYGVKNYLSKPIKLSELNESAAFLSSVSLFIATFSLSETSTTLTSDILTSVIDLTLLL